MVRNEIRVGWQSLSPGYRRAKAPERSSSAAGAAAATLNPGKPECGPAGCRRRRARCMVNAAIKPNVTMLRITKRASPKSDGPEKASGSRGEGSPVTSLIQCGFSASVTTHRAKKPPWKNRRAHPANGASGASGTTHKTNCGEKTLFAKRKISSTSNWWPMNTGPQTRARGVAVSQCAGLAPAARRAVATNNSVTRASTPPQAAAPRMSAKEKAKTQRPSCRRRHACWFRTPSSGRERPGGLRK